MSACLPSSREPILSAIPIACAPLIVAISIARCAPITSAFILMSLCAHAAMYIMRAISRNRLIEAASLPRATGTPASTSSGKRPREIQPKAPNMLAVGQWTMLAPALAILRTSASLIAPACAPTNRVCNTPRLPYRSTERQPKFFIERSLSLSRVDRCPWMTASRFSAAATMSLANSSLTELFDQRPKATRRRLPALPLNSS